MTETAILVPALVVHPRQRAIEPWVVAASQMVARAAVSLQKLAGIDLPSTGRTRIIEVPYETQPTFRAEWWNLHRVHRSVPGELLVAFTIGTSSRDSEYDGWASGRGGNGAAALSTSGLTAFYSWQRGTSDEERVNLNEWLIVHEIGHMLEEPHPADPRSDDCATNPMCYTAGAYADWKRLGGVGALTGYGFNDDQLGRLRRLGYVDRTPTRRLGIRAEALAETLRMMGDDVGAAKDIIQQLADRYAELKLMVEDAERSER